MTKTEWRRAWSQHRLENHFDATMRHLKECPDELDDRGWGCLHLEYDLCFCNEPLEEPTPAWLRLELSRIPWEEDVA